LKPVFADVDFESGCISCETIEPLITKKTKAISVVHLGGWPADMQMIIDMARSYNIKVIEDCSQAHGAKIKTELGFKSVGSFGDIGTWSFCQDKIITTGGEGGMVTTSDEKIWDFIWSYKDHGKDFQEVHRKDHPPGYRWLHKNFGTNYRLTEMQSAIGRYQLKLLPEWNKKRASNAANIITKISSIPCIRIPNIPENLNHGWYKLHCYLDETHIKDGWDRNKIIKEINSLGFPALQGSCSEIYMEKCFKNNNIYPKEILKNAKILGRTSLMFLIHPTITEVQIDKYSEAIYKVLKRACKN
jgi:dTDP-4-amino-4,6-dideoxygalactose transaminase